MIRLQPDSVLATEIGEFDRALVRTAAQPADTGRDRIAEEPAWSNLAEAGLLELPGVLRRAAASEIAGRRLVDVPFLDVMFAADVIAALAESPRGLTADIATGMAVPAIAVDRRLGVRAGADTGEVDVAVSVRGACLDGELRLVRAAGRADDILVVAPGAGGVVVALVGPDDPGISMVRQDDLGHSDLWKISLRRVNTTPERLHTFAVPAGQKWAATVDRARICLAAHLVGIADGAVGAAIAHVRKRVQFGRPVSTFQAVSFPLADALARIRAARLLVRHAAWAADAGHDIDQLAAQALGHAGDLAILATNRSLQAHGAIGLTSAALAARYYRQALIGSVWLGTTTALTEVAVAGLIKSGAHRLGREGRP